MARLEILRGDITTLAVDVIVNAANERMLGGGGVDGAIHRAAGPELLEACRKVPEVSAGVRCPTGEARITPGFRLPARYVVHTAGPIWQGGKHGEARLLASCYGNSLAVAERYGAKSVAFPAISCGVYGYPIDEAAAVAVRSVDYTAGHLPALERIFLCAFDELVESALRRAVMAIRSADC
jgi:O-acetyl-ADP-ribose deacetylase (regulator of RNase III)